MCLIKLGPTSMEMPNFFTNNSWHSLLCLVTKMKISHPSCKGITPTFSLPPSLRLRPTLTTLIFFQEERGLPSSLPPSSLRPNSRVPRFIHKKCAMAHCAFVDELYDSMANRHKAVESEDIIPFEFCPHKCRESRPVTI